MDIEDFEIKVKKYDTVKSVVYVNVTVYGVLEIRGYVVRYTTTKYSHGSSVWMVSPPAIKGKNRRYFWIVELKDTELWKQLQELIISKAKDYTNSI